MTQLRIDPIEELFVGLAIVDGWRGDEARERGKLMAYRIRQTWGAHPDDA